MSDNSIITPTKTSSGGLTWWAFIGNHLAAWGWTIAIAYLAGWLLDRASLKAQLLQCEKVHESSRQYDYVKATKWAGYACSVIAPLLFLYLIVTFFQQKNGNTKSDSGSERVSSRARSAGRHTSR